MKGGQYELKFVQGKSFDRAGVRGEYLISVVD
jgi:hypothetical protein